MVKSEIHRAIMDQENFKQKIHLVISVIIVVPVSFLYGFDRLSQLNIDLNTTDELNVFKGIMGLYLGLALLWLLGIFKQKYLYAALVSNTAFMLGLGVGRFFSIIIDGLPTAAFIFGTIGELVLGFYGLWVLKRLK